jgi:uncharacterized protein (TIGR04255 family)
VAADRGGGIKSLEEAGDQWTCAFARGRERKCARLAQRAPFQLPSPKVAKCEESGQLAASKPHDAKNEIRRFGIAILANRKRIDVGLSENGKGSAHKTIVHGSSRDAALTRRVEGARFALAAQMASPESPVFPTLSKEPILQVALQLTATARAPLEQGTFEKALAQFFPAGYKPSPVMEFTGGLNFDKGVPSEVPSKHLWKGVVFHSQDGKDALTFRDDSFGLSRSAPYPGWELFTEKAIEFWDVHRRVADPGPVTRLGLRFINSIEITLGSDIDNFVHGGPRDIPGLPMQIASFVHREQIVPLPYGKYFIQLIRALRPAVLDAAGKPAKTSGLIVDIDVFSPEPWDGGLEALREHLESMRVLKNKVFFGTVTDQVLKSSQ